MIMHLFQNRFIPFEALFPQKYAKLRQRAAPLAVPNDGEFRPYVEASFAQFGCVDTRALEKGVLEGVDGFYLFVVGGLDRSGGGS